MIELPRFIASLDNENDAEKVLCGFPYDCTSSFRAGSRFAPREVRSISYEAIEEFSFYFGHSLEEVKFCDIGDMPVMVGDPSAMIEEIRREAEKIVKRGKQLFAIGGEHLVTYPLYLAQKTKSPNMTILHLDAHADLREGYAGDELSHASVMNLCLKADLQRLIQYGIRSGTKEEYLMRQEDERITPANNLIELDDALDEGEELYISLDLDFFDPGFLPGTGTPEAGGASFNDFIDILRVLLKKRVKLVGVDIVELAPAIDTTGNSTVFTAKLLRELLIFSHLLEQ